MKRLVKRGRINVSVTSSTGVDMGTFQCASGANLRMEFLRRQLPKDEIYDPLVINAWRLPRSWGGGLTHLSIFTPTRAARRSEIHRRPPPRLRGRRHALPRDRK